MVEDDAEVAQSFSPLLAFLDQHPIALANPACRLGLNDIYRRVLGPSADLAALARDETDYKALIVQAQATADKIALAQQLANRRLARGVVPELDACFAALGLAAGSGIDVKPNRTSTPTRGPRTSP